MVAFLGSAVSEENFAAPSQDCSTYANAVPVIKPKFGYDVDGICDIRGSDATHSELLHCSPCVISQSNHGLLGKPDIYGKMWMECNENCATSGAFFHIPYVNCASKHIGVHTSPLGEARLHRSSNLAMEKSRDLRRALATVRRSQVQPSASVKQFPRDHRN